MKKLFAISCLSVLAGLYSCKEVPVYIPADIPGQEDTTYVLSSVETPQDKKYLIEELSGVQCVNCPAGIQKLTEMSTTGEFANKMTIVSIHVGTFAWIIKDDTKPQYNSKQDFVVPGSEQLLDIVFGGDPGKPCASFDRLRIGRPQDPLLLPNYNQWSSFMSSARDSSTTTPVNIYIETAEGASPDEFDIKVRLHYTEALSAKQSLNIYLVENNIRDAMKYALKTDTNYIFNHVLRKYITPSNGKRILSDVAIEPGRVYELRTKLTIDRNDKNQAFWNPAKMEVVAFVSSADDNSKRVYQSQYVHLKP